MTATAPDGLLIRTTSLVVTDRDFCFTSKFAYRETLNRSQDLNSASAGSLTSFVPATLLNTRFVPSAKVRTVKHNPTKLHTMKINFCMTNDLAPNDPKLSHADGRVAPQTR